MSSELITFNRVAFERWWRHNTRPMLMGEFDEPPAEVEDNRDELIEKMKVALSDMCNCAAAFQGRDTIPASEFMEKAGPVVANAAAVLGEIEAQ